MNDALTILNYAFQKGFMMLESLYIANHVSIVYTLLAASIGHLVMKLFLFPRS